jgi:hypothetical protein
LSQKSLYVFQLQSIPFKNNCLIYSFEKNVFSRVKREKISNKDVYLIFLRNLHYWVNLVEFKKYLCGLASTFTLAAPKCIKWNFFKKGRNFLLVYPNFFLFWKYLKSKLNTPEFNWNVRFKRNQTQSWLGLYTFLTPFLSSFNTFLTRF